MKNYETVFILDPILSEQQVKDTVAKFKSLITDNGGEVYHQEDWGLRRLAYPIQNKKSGFYSLFEFKAAPSFLKKLEIEYRRDESIIRFLTLALDKHAVEFNEKRRQGAFNKAKKVEKVANED
jgi:small subunit ribosomal protein S6